MRRAQGVEMGGICIYKYIHMYIENSREKSCMVGDTGKAVSHHKEFDNALNVSRSVPKGISIFPQWHCSSNQFAMHARTCAAAGCCDAGSQSKTRLANRGRNKRNREVWRPGGALVDARTECWYDVDGDGDDREGGKMGGTDQR